MKNYIPDSKVVMYGTSGSIAAMCAEVLQYRTGVELTNVETALAAIIFGGIVTYFVPAKKVQIDEVVAAVRALVKKRGET